MAKLASDQLIVAGQDFETDSKFASAAGYFDNPVLIIFEGLKKCTFAEMFKEKF